ncbi:MAG: zinc ribbon domain-containing protein [Bacilli bacterium]|nr:zinc ribbon domain-containing protein [Bacilli bacterium]
MNFCTSCGSKLKKNVKFCTNCGQKVITEEEKKEIKRKEEKKNQNIILLLGIFLVLFATFALGIISWKNLNEILKLSFFGFECLLFFGLSYILKKLTDSKIYRLFFVVGLILIPYCLTLIPYYGLLSSYFNKGPGLYVYLSIIYFITFIIYLIINSSFKSKFINFLSLIILLVSFIFVALIFSKSITIISLLITVYLFLMTIISYTNIVSEDLKKIMHIFVSIMIFVDIIPLLLSYVSSEKIIFNIIKIISFIIYLLAGYIRIHKNDNSVYEGFLPFSYHFLSFILIINLLIDYEVVFLYVYTIISLLFYFISLVFNKKVFSNITLGITYYSLIILMIASSLSNYNSVFLIIAIITLLFNIFSIIVSKIEWINYIIPINIFVIIVGISKITINFKFIYILLIAALIYLLVYVVLKALKKKYSMTYLITSYSLGMISMYNFVNGFNLINFGIVLIFLLIFVFSNLFKENEAISIISFISLNLTSLAMYSSVSNTLFYGLLTISGLTLIFSLLLTKFKKLNLKSYILYSEIVIFIITLTNNMHYSSYILFISIFIYAISYLSVIKFHNKKWWRIAYIMLGLLTITRVINTVIDPIVIASIISIIVLLIILVIMYLLEIENNISLTLISFITLFPYYNLVGNTMADIEELYLLPIIVYLIIFTEIIKFKNPENKKLTTIIPLSILCYYFVIIGSGVPSIIIDIILALVIIILGLYRKYNYLIYFGVIFIVITLFIRLFTILNSVAVVIMLIILGFILIGLALFNELRKKK